MTPAHDPVGNPVRVALVGLGGHGGTMQRAAEAAEGVAVVAVYDPNQAEARQAAERFGCPAVPTYEALFARDDVEAVVLVTPNQVHRAQAEAAFAAGRDVLVEKPIANTVADGRAIVAAAEAAGRVLFVGHNMRYGRAARLGRRLLDEGRLGTLVTVEVHFSADNTRRLPPDAWRLRPEECPLLPVMQLGIHAVDLLHYLVGPVVEVGAFARSVTTAPGVVDSVAALLLLAPGVTGTLVSNYCTQVTFAYRLSGTEGTLEATPHRVAFRSAAATDAGGGGPYETHDFSDYDLESYTRQMEAFGEAVRSRRPPETDGWAGLRALAVVEALQEAAATGRLVPVMFEPTSA